MRHTTMTTTTDAHEYRVSRDELLAILRRGGLTELLDLPNAQIMILDAVTQVTLDEGLVIRYEVAHTAGGAEELLVPAS